MRVTQSLKTCLKYSYCLLLTCQTQVYSIEHNETPLSNIDVAGDHINCQDNIHNFNIHTFNNSQQNCKWLSEQDIKIACEIKQVRDNCPKTCDLCTNENSRILGKNNKYPWCKDSKRRFRFVERHSGKKKKQRCNWIKKKHSYRCTFDGVREKCPSTCGFCQCLNNESSKFKISIGDSADSMQDCTWVSESVSERCDSEEAKANCPQVCGDCTVPSMQPSAAPTPTEGTPTSGETPTVPTGAVDKAPDYTWCGDSQGKFEFVERHSGKDKKENCNWIKKKHSYRCTFDGVREKCPSTCGFCQCLNNESSKFKISIGDSADSMQDCTWVSESVSERCDSEEAKANCPQVCGDCTVPSMQPSAAPSISSKPSIAPSITSSMSPSGLPSMSANPSLLPSLPPTLAPSRAPSRAPSSAPSRAPSSAPSTNAANV